MQEPGTAAYKGSFKLAQADSCADFFDRAMYWKIPTHSLICGDADGNIALQVTGLTPDRDGWNGRLPVPGMGEYEWRGFRSDLPREFNPDRGYIATANNNVHPPGYEGRPVFYHSSSGVETSRITRLHQILGSGEQFSVEDHQEIQHDAFSLRAVGDIPTFKGWNSEEPDVEQARGMIAEWDAVLTRDSAAGAIYVRWADLVDPRAQDPGTPSAERRAAIEEGLRATVRELTKELGPDWSEWRYGRTNESELPHMITSVFDLPTVQRPGGFGDRKRERSQLPEDHRPGQPGPLRRQQFPGQSAQPREPVLRESGR